jgi:hypothetical protein
MEKIVHHTLVQMFRLQNWYHMGALFCETLGPLFLCEAWVHLANHQHSKPTC